MRAALGALFLPGHELGVPLNEAQTINAAALSPWLMLLVVPVIVVVLAFNFFGDGLRDAADRYRADQERPVPGSTGERLQLVGLNSTPERLRG